MFVGSAQENIVKITFDPLKEALLPGDFLSIVNDKAFGTIVQVLKLKNSEKTATQSAIGKIIFTFNKNNIEKWIGNVPSSKDIVKKISPNKALKEILSEESEDTINLGKIYPSSKNLFNVDIDKFDGLNLILGDKQKQKIQTSLFFAEKFIKYGLKTVIIDIKGEYKNIPSAITLKAGDNFKLPLDFKGIEKLYENCLSGASAETKAVIEDVFSEVQEYAESSEIGFIPFNDFKNVVEEQYNENKIPELILLKNKLISLSREGIFSDRKNEIDAFQAALVSKDLVIVDLSEIPALWHKDFLDSILNKSSEFILFIEGTESILSPEIVNKININGIEKGIIPFISIESTSKYISSFLTYAKNIFITSQLRNSEAIFEIKDSLFGLNFADMVVYGEISGFLPLAINPAIEEQIIEVQNELEEEEIIEEIPQESYEEVYEQTFDQQEEDFSDLYDEEETEEEVEENIEAYEEVSEETNEEQEDVFYYDESEDETPLYEEETEQEEYEEPFVEQPQEEITEQEENFEDIPEDVYDEVEKLYTYQGEEDSISYDDLASETIEEEEEPEQASNNIPVYTTPKEENTEIDIELFEGDRVKHEKYGVGVVNRIISYGNKKLCSIQFDNVGRRLLDPTLASLEKV